MIEEMKKMTQEEYFVKELYVFLTDKTKPPTSYLLLPTSYLS